jgi:hypothetical protein
MKKGLAIVLVMAVTVLLSSAAFGQLTAYGPKLGLNLAKLSGDDVEKSKIKTGVAIGGFATFGFGEIFALQPELYYSMKGDKEDGFVGEIPATRTIKLSYLEVPVLAKVNLPTQSKVKPALFAGPSLGIKLGSKVKIEAGGQSQEATLEDIKSIDLGLVVGIGIDFKMTNGTICLDGRYTMGLSSIDDSPDNLSYKNNVIGFLAGYSFGK